MPPTLCLPNTLMLLFTCPCRCAVPDPESPLFLLTPVLPDTTLFGTLVCVCGHGILEGFCFTKETALVKGENEAKKLNLQV